MRDAFRESRRFFAERDDDELRATGTYWRGARERLDDGERATYHEAPDPDAPPEWWS